MSSAKEKHYWSQLRSALTAGQWLSEFPSKTPHGAQLSWPELFRKFNKHCKGFHDVSELASQNYGLALLLASNSLNEDEDYADVRDFSVELGNESILPAERVEETIVGYETLKTLQGANGDSVHFALAYYAYALGRPSDCLSHLAQVPDFSQIQTFIPSVATSRSSTSNLLSVPTGGQPSASSSVTGGSSSFIDSSVAEVKDGRGWALTETFRSLCLQGMCHERLDPRAPKKALRAYRAALPTFRTLQSTEFASLISTPARLPSGKLDYTPFIQLRELWRWVERLLWRAICLSSRTSNVHTSDEEEDLWLWLEKYTICSASWPPTFRTEHRSTISSIYLRALVLRHGSPGTAARTHYWMQTARSVVQDYRAILNVSTKFPRAGERNVKVEEFADLCVSVWEASGANGEQAGWVLDVLWWATRLTFNSSRVLRHMTRLFHLSGDTNLAKRSLRLYVQVVSKAWQASRQGAGESVNPNDNDSQVNAAHDGYLEDTDTDVNWVETLVFGARLLCKAASSTPGTQDIDDVREAQSILSKAKERMKFAETSDPLFQRDSDRLNAEVELAEGIADSVLAIKGQDQYARPGLLESSHKHLLQSIDIHPTPSAYFHLALSYARHGPRHDLDQAIQHAGSAAQGNPRDIRYWHLLGLLLTSAERWEEANTILAHGADLDLFSGSEVNPPTETQPGSPEEGSIPVENESANNDTTTVISNTSACEQQGSIRTRRQSKSFALNINLNGDNGSFSAISRTITSETVTPVQIEHVGDLITTVLPFDATFVPASSHLLRSILGPVSSSKQELFEWGLQLQMTQMALTEVRQGAEGAEEGWLEVFNWVAEKRGLVQPATSVDGAQHLGPTNDVRRPFDQHSQHMSTLSVSALKATTVESTRNNATDESYPRAESAEVSVSSMSNSNGDVGGGHNSAPPPITISPASPGVDSSFQLQQTEENSSFRDGGLERRSSFSATEKKSVLGALGRVRRSSSLERSEKGEEREKEKGGGGDTSKSKNLQQMLKNRVQKGQMKISAVGRKIGHGVTRNGTLRRSNSTPDFHAVLQSTTYQASSIHSRRRLSSIIHSEDRTPTESPTPPPPLAPSPIPFAGRASTSTATIAAAGPNSRSAREKRLISDLWLMSAATFRRLSKIDQAKGAIQEGEVQDEDNPNVWVQLALYYSALNHHQHAISTLQKALFIDPDNVSATVHLARLYLTPREGTGRQSASEHDDDNNPGPPVPDYTGNPTSSAPASSSSASAPGLPSSSSPSRLSQSNIDLACGLLTHLSKGRGWDVPEVWYFLATAYRLQGRAEREVEALEKALNLAEGRGVREVGAAIGICI